MTKPGPGKFQANESLEIAEDLYRQVQDGMVSEEFGTVEDGGFWEGLLLDQLDTLNTPDLQITVPEGMQRAYIVTEDSQGFFTYRGYDSEADARYQYALEAGWEASRTNFKGLHHVWFDDNLTDEERANVIAVGYDIDQMFDNSPGYIEDIEIRQEEINTFIKKAAKWWLNNDRRREIRTN